MVGVRWWVRGRGRSRRTSWKDGYPETEPANPAASFVSTPGDLLMAKKSRKKKARKKKSANHGKRPNS